MKTITKIYSLLFFTLSFSFLTSSSIAQYNVLYNFNGTNGANPNSSQLTLVGSKFYGLTSAGGAYGDGVIFSINTNGSGYKDLFDFDKSDGLWPYGSLTYGAGVLYGMTYEGGANNLGVIFSIDTSGSSFIKLLDFNGTNGSSPFGNSLTLSGNILYGMTYHGGNSSYAAGVIFSMHTNGSGFKTLLNFNDTNGAAPFGDLALYGNKLYGMTRDGGIPLSDSGNIFSIDTNGYGYKNLFYFNKANGYHPYGNLTMAGGVMYGMTSSGGLYDSGSIFKIDTNGNGFKKVLDFNVINGEYPLGGLILSTNTLYGMTPKGGANDLGVLFSIDTNGHGYKDLFDFSKSSGTNPGDGGSLILSANVFYGMTVLGGTNNDGIIFSFTDTLTGINELSAESGSVKVYPNPSNGVYTISSSSCSGQLLVEVYNILGEKVYSQNLQQALGSNQINISNNRSGIYLYKITNDKGKLVSSGKLLLE